MMKFLRRLQLCTETRRASVFSLPAVAVSGLPSTIAATAAAERLQVCNSRSDRKRKAENDGLLLTPPSSSLLSLRRCFNVPGPPSLHRAPPISIPLGQRREFRCGEHQRWNCIKAFATVLCQWILWRSFIGKELPPHIVVGMPALLPTMDHGNIAKWQKKEGDKIEVGDVICEIETDKATLEFESLEEGYLAKILASEGSKDVHVGQPIAITVEDPDDSAKVPSTVSSVSSGLEVEEEKSTQGHTETREKVQKTSFSRISPAARLLITEFGLDASSLTASGPRGTLSKGDVLAAIKSGTRHSKTSDSSQVKVSSSAPPQLEHTPKPASVSSSSSLPVDADEDIPNSQIRKVIAKRLLESKQGTPHLYLSSDVILDPLLSLRKELQVQHGVKVSVNDIDIKAGALALRNVPEANGFDDSNYKECRSEDSVSNLLRATSLDASYSISTLFDACKTLGSLQQIHAHIIRRGFEQDNLLITRFVGFCNSFSAVPYAVSVFDRVFRPNIYLWNSILKGSCKSLLKNTFSLFRRMMRSDTPPDCYTFPSLLKACSHVSAVWEGRAIHCAILRCGVDSDLYVQTGLVDFYGKCMETGCARKVFDGMLERNEVSWTAMIVGCTCTGDIGAARELFEEMPCKNVATWNVMVDACAKRGDLKNARKFFDEMPERNAISYTSLIDGYAKAGDMASARFLFDQSVERDIFSWSALISGYAQNGQPKEALKIFLEMCEKNIKPDEFVMVGLMSACSQIGNLDLAKWVESLITQNAIDPSQAHVTAALIDMNAKCGNMERAMQLFGTLKSRDIISYCSLMQGLSIHGFGAEAVELFSKMLGEGIVPDNAAFIVVLTACSHKGLVEEGCQYFESMKNEYGIIPLPDHYACMVDLLSRAGRLRDAYDLIKSMPMEPHATAWGALLGACRLHCDIELGETVASRLFELEPQNAANYVLLSNIYATADRWADVSNIRATMTERGVRKIPGCSWI